MMARTLAAMAPAARPPLPFSAEPRDQPALPAGYYVRSSAWGYAQALPAFVVLLLSAAGIGSAGVVWLPLCLIGVVLAGYRLTFVVHDCSHRTLFHSRVENEIVGWAAASLLLISFPAYRRLHWQHHLHYRRPGDPQGHDYNGLVPGRDRVLWHLLKPLVLANLLEKVGAFFALQHSGMTAAERRALPAGLNETPRVRVLALAAIALAQVAVLLLATAGLAFPFGYGLFLLPLVTVGLFISRVRSYLEHGSLTPAHDAVLVARTHPSHWVERNLLAGLNFNFHNEHHRWPQVPSRHLPAVHRDVTAGALAGHEYSVSYAASARVLVRACVRRHGGA